LVTLKFINLVYRRVYKSRTTFNQAVGVFLNPRHPKYEAQMLTTQSRPFNLSFIQWNWYWQCSYRA